MPLPGGSERDEAASVAARDAGQDARLVERVLRGDADAYGELVRRHMRRAFSIAYCILEHREDAEDVMQEAFIRALERIDTLERGRPFHPWFYRIVVNRSLSYRRSRSRRATEPIPEGARAPSPSPEREAERAELRERLKRALDALPEEQRLIVQLSELEGLNSTEVAEILEMPAGTVRWHLHRSRRTLRAALDPRPAPSGARALAAAAGGGRQHRRRGADAGAGAHAGVRPPLPRDRRGHPAQDRQGPERVAAHAAARVAPGAAARAGPPGRARIPAPGRSVRGDGFDVADSAGAYGTRASTRTGLPVPSRSFIGAAIRTAPRGGSRRTLRATAEQGGGEPVQ